MAETDDFRLSVKNAAWTLTEEEQQRVTDAIRTGAAKGEEPKDCYYVYGADDGSDWCKECGQKEVAKAKARRNRLSKAAREEAEIPSLDGGYRTEHDSTPFCEGCHTRLDGGLTHYGAEQELEHFLEHGFDLESADDCLAVEEAIETIGWHLHLNDYSQYQHPSTTDNENRDAQERHWNLGKLARHILTQLDSCKPPSTSPKSSTAAVA